MKRVLHISRRAARVCAGVAVAGALYYFVSSGYEDGKRQSQEQQLRETPVYAQLKAQAAELDENAMTLKIDEAIGNMKDKQTGDAIIQYLEDDSYDHGDDARLKTSYFARLADLYISEARGFSAEADKATAYRKGLGALLTLEALARADALRCKDTTAFNGFAEDVLNPRYLALQPGFKYVGDSNASRLVNDAFAFEMSHSHRAPNAAVCKRGAEETPQYIEPDLWQAKRIALQAGLRDALNARLASISKR